MEGAALEPARQTREAVRSGGRPRSRTRTRPAPKSRGRAGSPARSVGRPSIGRVGRGGRVGRVRMVWAPRHARPHEIALTTVAAFLRLGRSGRHPVRPSRHRPCCPGGGGGMKPRAARGTTAGKRRGGTYWGEQVPPQQRPTGGNRQRRKPSSSLDVCECTHFEVRRKRFRRVSRAACRAWWRGSSAKPGAAPAVRASVRSPSVTDGSVCPDTHSAGPQIGCPGAAGQSLRLSGRGR